MTVSTVYLSLWRHRLFIVAMTAILVGTAFFVSSRQTKLYTASSLVRVQQKVKDATEVFGSLQTGERLARTYAEIATTDTVSAEVRRALGNRVPRDAIKIDASQVEDLELLRLSVTNADPRVAALVANAVPKALATVVQRSGAIPDTISTVDPAGVPSSPSSPNVPLTLVIAFIVALILNAALVLTRDAFSDRIEDAEELERITGHPVIATIPTLRFSSEPTASTDGQLGQTATRPKEQGARSG